MSDKQQLTTCYKVTTLDNQSYISNWKFIRATKFMIQYKPDRWIYPKLKKAVILAFKTVDDAKRFLQKDGITESYNIWECQTDSIVDRFLLPIFNDNYETELKRINSKTYVYNWGDIGLSDAQSPKGTIGCNRIRLLKKLETVTPETARAYEHLLSNI